jgi:lysophospholipase L1-like esterase
MTSLLLATVLTANSQTIVAFGDSTTALRNSVEQVYAERLEAKLKASGHNVKVINAGIGGNNTDHARARFERDVLNHDPETVIIQFGLNDSAVDVWKGAQRPRVSQERFRENLELFCSELKSRNIRTVLMTPNPGFWTHGLAERYGKAPYDVNDRWGFNLLVKDYVETVRSVAQSSETGLLDVYKIYQERDAASDLSATDLLVDSMHPNDSGHEIVASALAELLQDPPVNRGYSIPNIDLDDKTEFHVVVDKEKGQYLGHPTTVLLEDGKTILTVYPKGHGRGGIVYKKSTDGGKTWSDRLPIPESWLTSREVPTMHRVIGPITGKKRLIMWSGLYPARLAVSEDDGDSWSELEIAGDWGGIVVMGFVHQLKNGHYMAMFHDDGRFFKKGGKRTGVFTLYTTFSKDGGLTWSYPDAIWSGSDVHLCEPGIIRSPDSNQLCVLLRENSRTKNSHVIFSDDEGQSWTEPKELPGSLTGDRHTAVYSQDGRLFISFRDMAHDSPTRGDWVGWVGTYEDILNGREGQYRVRLKDNTKGTDCAYPGVVILPDNTIVTTTYGHWDEGEQPYIRTVRFKLSDLDRIAESG